MALTQRQLAECASEALAAQQAFDQLRAGVEEALERYEVSPEARLALIQFILRDLPIPGTARSEQALAHIERTRKRNEKRARLAREARAGKVRRSSRRACSTASR